jgi:hypothetical protein
MSENFSSEMELHIIGTWRRLVGPLALAFRLFFLASTAGFFAAVDILPESSKKEAAGIKS